MLSRVVAYVLKRKDTHLLVGAAAERSEEARKEAARKARPMLLL